MQQYLPFTVLKPHNVECITNIVDIVATVLTVYGIETSPIRLELWKNLADVATVLTVYGIETIDPYHCIFLYSFPVATVLTVYGIETTKNVDGMYRDV